MEFESRLPQYKVSRVRRETLDDCGTSNEKVTVYVRASAEFFKGVDLLKQQGTTVRFVRHESERYAGTKWCAIVSGKRTGEWITTLYPLDTEAAVFLCNAPVSEFLRVIMLYPIDGEFLFRCYECNTEGLVDADFLRDNNAPKCPKCGDDMIYDSVYQKVGE